MIDPKLSRFAKADALAADLTRKALSPDCSFRSILSDCQKLTALHGERGGSPRAAHGIAFCSET